MKSVTGAGTSATKSGAGKSGIQELIEHRVSPYAWSIQPVEHWKIRRVLEAASCAPSALNEQPWRFVVGSKGSTAFGNMVELLRPANRLWAPNAPAFILTLIKLTLTKNGQPNEYAEHDLGYATAFLNLEAEALGLRAHVMAGPRKERASPIGFDVERARDLFSIPPDFTPFTIIALGYEGSMSSLPEDLRHKEEERQARRVRGEHRRPLDDIAAFADDQLDVIQKLFRI